MRTHGAGAHATTRLVFGLAVMVMGLLLTLDNFGVVQARELIRFWPVLIVALGLAKMVHPSSTAHRSGGFVMLLGLGLLLVNLDLLRFKVLLAGVLLAFGALMVWRAARTRAEAPPPALADDGRSLDVSSFMSFVHRAVGGSDFRGGSATAVMGACEIDLRRASIADGEATLDTFAFWGGIEIKVPADWMVETRGTALLGAFEDTSRKPDDRRQKLIVSGFALMGGIEVKN